MNIILEAAQFATNAHAGQKRKYCNEDYIWHPARVACKIMMINPMFTVNIGYAFIDNLHESMVAAAFLHDAPEDCNIHIDDIYFNFGQDIGSLVRELTNPIKDKFLSRQERKAIDRKHLKNASLPAKMIKLADRIDNLKSLTNASPEFRVIHWEESVLLRQVLVFVNPELEKELDDILLNFKF